MAGSEAGGSGEGEGVTLLVCLTCGREYEAHGAEAPAKGLRCEKCGGEVFRQFDDTSTAGEAQAEFREETERDLATSDPEGDAEPGDLHDLSP
jgi:DNA-directed RNA polymerase subunit RPC12/RpoP